MEAGILLTTFLLPFNIGITVFLPDKTKGDKII